MLKRFIDDIRKYFRYSVVSARSQLKAEVAGSYLNWVWWILDPLCFMLIYTFIFGYVFSGREQYFSIYIFIGLTMWQFFEKTLKASVKLIKNNKSIVSKVYFPKYILILSQMWVAGFKLLISFGIVALMMLINWVPVSWNILFVIPILITLMLITFGCSCFLLHFGVDVEDMANVVNIVLRVVFYMTGIFYNIEKRIAGWGTYLNSYNPMAYLLTSMRGAVMYSTTPVIGLLCLWFAVGLILSILGVRRIYKEENSYVKAI